METNKFKKKDHVAFNCAGHKTHGTIVEVKDDGEYIVNSFGCFVAVKGEDLKMFEDKVQEKESNPIPTPPEEHPTDKVETPPEKPKRGRKPNKDK